jgi:hypothetical protein
VTRDPLGDLADPGLREFFDRLTGDPTPEELSGEHAALAMFRSAFRSATYRRVPVRSHRSYRRSRVGGRLVTMSAALAVLGGFAAAAAYAEVLPEPLQRIAHEFIGAPSRTMVKPGVTNGPTRPAEFSLPTLRPSHPRSASTPPRSRHSLSPHPRSPRPSAPAGSRSLTIAAAHRQITAGDSVRITASLSYRNAAANGIQLSLTELPAGGGSAWRVVDQAVTGPQGRALFAVASLTTNTSFRVAGPDQITSRALSIVVIPPVSVSLVSDHHRHFELLVAAPLAQRGDVVELQVRAAGKWQAVRSRGLDETGQTNFSIEARKISVTYRVVLLATTKYGQSVSKPVTVPARDRWGGDG